MLLFNVLLYTEKSFSYLYIILCVVSRKKDTLCAFGGYMYLYSGLSCSSYKYACASLYEGVC